MKVGFIGLGNVGGKLAGSLLRNKFNLNFPFNFPKYNLFIFFGSEFKNLK